MPNRIRRARGAGALILAGLPLGVLFLAGLAAPARAAGITRADWGTAAGGEAVGLYTLTGANGLVARITNFGGVIVNLMVPDRTGAKADVVLGYDDLASYEKGGVYGAIIGRYANRIGNNASFPLDGRIVQLDHPPGQSQLLHSGPHGFQKRVWTAVMKDGAEPSLILTLVSPDGDTGFPGTLTATVRYTVTRDNALRLDYRAVTDKPTVVNLTNHAYFNLGGEASGDILDERVQIFADRYTPLDEAGVPTGAIVAVAGTPLDFTRPVRVGDVVDSAFSQMAYFKGLNANLIVRGRPGRMRPAARVWDPKSGRVMEVTTTEPALQLYSDNITGTVRGKGGVLYGNRNALSLETEHYPDAPNHPNFPSTEITPARPLHEVTLFKFSTH